MAEAGTAARCGSVRPGGEGRRNGHQSKSAVDSPIYLRAKFVGTTHISMSILEFLDSLRWVGGRRWGSRVVQGAKS